jgi:hypothetical protein
MLPRVELNYLLGAVAKAEEFARKGKLLAGYRYLVDRLNDAMDALEAGNLWAVESVQRYWQAINAYTRKYRVKPAPSSARRPARRTMTGWPKGRVPVR